MPQRLRERPLAGHRDVDRAGRHRRDALERGRPGALERGPGRAQAIRISGAPVGAAGEAAVELGLDERDHVDAVDAQEAVAVDEPRCVDVRPLHLDPAHHDAGQVSPDEPGATQVRADELRSLQVVGPGEGCHDSSLSGARSRWRKGAPASMRAARVGPHSSAESTDRQQLGRRPDAGDAAAAIGRLRLEESGASAHAGLGQDQLDPGRGLVVARDLGHDADASARNRSTSGTTVRGRRTSSRPGRGRPRVGGADSRRAATPSRTSGRRVDHRRQRPKGRQHRVEVEPDLGQPGRSGGTRSPPPPRPRRSRPCARRPTPAEPPRTPLDAGRAEPGHRRDRALRSTASRHVPQGPAGLELVVVAAAERGGDVGLGAPAMKPRAGVGPGELREGHERGLGRGARPATATCLPAYLSCTAGSPRSGIRRRSGRRLGSPWAGSPSPPSGLGVPGAGGVDDGARRSAALPAVRGGNVHGEGLRRPDRSRRPGPVPVGPHPTTRWP